MNHPTDNPLVFPIVKASLTLIVVVLAVAACVYGLLDGVFHLESQARPSKVGAFISLVVGLTRFVPV